jgi:hypothetical protein
MPNEPDLDRAHNVTMRFLLRDRLGFLRSMAQYVPPVIRPHFLDACEDIARAALAGTAVAQDWTPITESNLPRVGDEVGYWVTTGLGELWLVKTCAVNWSLSQCRIAGWTHFRPINPPTPAPGAPK